jgi:dienelactone hydrolase
MWVSQTSNLGIGFTTPKTEFSTVVVVNVEKKNSFSVFAKYPSILGGVSRYFGLGQRDGRLYGYFSGITLQRSSVSSEYLLQGANADLYEVDLDSSDARKIAEMPRSETHRSWLVNKNGSIAAYLDFRPTRGDWRLVNASGKTIASGVQPLGDVDLVGFGRHTDTLLYVVREGLGEAAWYELPLAGGDTQKMFTDGGAEGVIHARGTAELIGFVRHDKQEFFDSRYRNITALVTNRFARLDAHVVAWDDSFDHVLVRTDGNGDPGTWWQLDMKTVSFEKLARAYDIDASQIGPIRVLNYTATDGLEMDGVLTLPPGREAKNLPVVVLPHGGPAAHDLPYFDWMAQAFAARGYAVFQPNFRGSTGRGVQFELKGHAQWGRKMQTDISDGLAELVKQGIVDPKRACIVGASYGGYAALTGVTVQSGLYRCAVSFAGIGDLTEFRNESLRASGNNQTRRRNLDEDYGPVSTLDEVSPIKFVNKVDAPILLIHGKDDVVVPYGQSEEMARALRKAGKQVELLTLEGEDHWLSRSKTRMQMLEAAVSFVEKHNPH